MERINKKEARVFYDGNCNLCASLSKKLKELDIHQHLVFINFRQYNHLQDPSFNFSQAEKELLVQDLDSKKWFNGYNGVIFALQIVESTKLYAKLLKLPIIRLLGIPIYKFIAKRRFSFMGTSYTCDKDSCKL